MGILSTSFHIHNPHGLWHSPEQVLANLDPLSERAVNGTQYFNNKSSVKVTVTTYEYIRCRVTTWVSFENL